MKLFTLSLHIGTKDLQTIFSRLGHTLDVWSISDHTHIFGEQRAQVDVCNQNTWRNLDQKMCDAFYERYKYELSGYDAFISYYTPAMAALFERFEKPIILYIPLRYESGLSTDSARWFWFNNWIEKNVSAGKINSIVTNNLYDQQYFKYYTGMDAQLIPSLCDYTGAQYTGKFDKHLFTSKFPDFLGFVGVPNLIDKKTIINYSWQDLANYRSMVYLPYSNSNISVFENYSAGIPMFFPTIDFLRQLWTHYRDKGVMSELSWFQILGLLLPIGIAANDPNNYQNPISFERWIPLSDFYSLPHIQLYESIRDLEDKLLSLDLKKISEQMLEHNTYRREQILSDWDRILRSI